MTEAQLNMQKRILWQEACGKLRAMADTEFFRKDCGTFTTSVAYEKSCTERWLKLNKAIEDFIANMTNEGLAE